MEELVSVANELKLGFIKRHGDRKIKEMLQRGLSLEEGILELLQEECQHRRYQGEQRRIREAKFPQLMTLDTFKESEFSEQTRQILRQIQTLEFIREKQNVILVGNPGTGKTHFGIGIGIEACMQGYNVLFVNAPNLVIQIKEALSESQYVRLKRKFERIDLVILDELGYFSFDTAGAELLFNLLSDRHEKGSVLITTNLTFDRWQECFQDATLTGALLDRLTYKAHVADMRGNSYRIKATKSWLTSK